MQKNLIENDAVKAERSHSKRTLNIDYRKLSDEDLVKTYVEEQKEVAFNEIVSRYADRVFRLALRITHNPSDAEEVLQEVFLRMEKLNTFRKEAKFSTWFFGIVTNASYKHLRKKRKRINNLSLENHLYYYDYGVLESLQLKDWSNIPDELLINHERMEIIEKAVGEMPLAYRVIFHLRYVEGLTNQEAADVLGLSIPAIKSRTLRARIFLKGKLLEYFLNGESRTNTKSKREEEGIV